MNGAEYELLRIRDDKSKNAKRYLSLTERVQSMLRGRVERNDSNCIFFNENGDGPYRISSLDHQNKRLRKQLQLPEDAVIHSLRHTRLTRLGESGAEEFAIMKMAGYSSVTVSERYTHPSSESVERTFSKLQEFSAGAIKQRPATMADSRPRVLETSVVQVKLIE